MPSHRRATRLAGLCASERARRPTCSRYVRGGGAASRGAQAGVRDPRHAAAQRLLVCRVTLPHSAPGQGVSRPPHAASRDCRSAHPLSGRSRVRLHRNAGSRRKRQTAGNQQAKRLAKRCGQGTSSDPHSLSPTPHAAQRAVPGWRGGLGRVGADLASAGSMRPPPSPARHVSTARLATTKASKETARHASTAWLATTHARR